MSNAIIYLESIDFIKRGPAWIAMVLVVVTLAYSGWSGDRWRDRQTVSVQNYAAEKLQGLADWRSKLQAVEAGEVEPTPYDGNPMSISFPAVLWPSPLADFAPGHTDLQPQVAEISPWRNAASMFGRYQFDNPATLAVGRFDIAFVIVVLMPILMIAVSFDTLAGERSRGTLPLLLSFPVRATRIVWTRLLVRNTLLWLVALAIMTILLLVNDSGGENRPALFVLWAVVSIAYALFWFSVIALCVAFNRTVTGTAATLVALWAIFVIATPAAIATVSESLYPTPSRLNYLSQIRQAEGETNRELDKLTSGFLVDHPELTVSEAEVPAYFRGAWLSNDAARKRTESILNAYESAWDSRDRMVASVQFLSPAVMAQRLLHTVSGADLDRQRQFQLQARESLYLLSAAVGPAVVSRNRISVSEFDQMEPFEFRDRDTADLVQAIFAPFAYLLLLSALLCGIAHRRLARQPVVA